MTYQVGNVTSITYPGGGAPVTQVYDELNRLKAINGFADYQGQGFWYDAAGNLTKMQYNNGTNNIGIITQYQYNNRGLLSRIQSPVLDLQYVYDTVGNITGINNEVYSYDGLNRLHTANKPANNYQATYQYDAVGNRTEQVEDGITTIYTHSPVNALTTSTGTTYTWDARGNLVGKVQGSNTWVYTYDLANRLTQVTKNGITLGTYAYDANGIRAKKVEGGATTHYLALGHQVMYEKTGAEATRHIFAGNQRIAEVRGGVISYFHNDHLGSPRVVTSAAGVVTATMANKPFGEPHAGSTLTSYGFTGKDLDDTGLYYFSARYYDPAVGRFITEDSWVGRLSTPSSQNRYVYVVNNPLKYVDPTGNTYGGMDLLDSGGAAALYYSATQAEPWLIPALQDIGQGILQAGVEFVSGLYPSLVHNASAIMNSLSGAKDKAGSRSSGGSGGNSFSPDPNDPLGKTVRQQLLDSVENKALKNAINQLYRPGGTIGDGGTADKIRYERAMGEFVQHAQKGFERVTHLNKILRTEQLSPSDRAIAMQLLNDLQNALGGLRR